MKIGNSILRLVLECIKVWAYSMPINPLTKGSSKFASLYSDLVDLNVKFPKNFKFYKNFNNDLGI